jgi:hypothetical protein
VIPSPLALWWHPLPLAAAAITALNDHWWKQAWPSALTGKISDLCGLFFAPLLVATVAALCTPVLRSRAGQLRTLATAAAALAFLFAAIQLSPTFAGQFADQIGRHLFGAPLAVTPDPSDLLALPALVAAVWWGQRRLAAFA